MKSPTINDYVAFVQYCEGSPIGKWPNITTVQYEHLHPQLQKQVDVGDFECPIKLALELYAKQVKSDV